MNGAAPLEERSSWESLDRQDWDLWILAVMLVAVLGASLLGFMVPGVFWAEEQKAAPTLERAFVGFGVLLVLTLVYLLQRQAAVRGLKRSLYLAQAAARAAEQELHLVSLTSLPALGQFHDSLAMEYRRASNTGEPLAIILMEFRHASEEKLGEAAHLLRALLRRGESLFRLSGQRLAVILPAMRSAQASAFADQLAEQLRSGLPAQETSCTIISYPEQAGSLAEMEARMRVLVS